MLNKSAMTIIWVLFTAASALASDFAYDPSKVIEKRKAEIQSLMEQNDALKKSLAQVNLEKEKLDAEVGSLNATIESLSAEKNEQKSAIARLNQKIDSINQIQIESRLEQLRTERVYIYLLASLAVCSLFLILYFLRDRIATPAEVVPVAGLVLIIWGTIILVIVVDTTEQLTAAIGVLGTIGGYLFGQLNRREASATGAEKKMASPTTTPSP